MIDTDKYEGHTEGPWEPYEIKTTRRKSRMWTIGNLSVEWKEADKNLVADAPLLLEAYKQLREDYEKMSEVLRQYGMDICRHCRVIYRDDDMNHPHYPSLHPWHMDGMCMKEMIE